MQNQNEDPRSVTFLYNAPLEREDDISHVTKIDDGADYFKLKKYKVCQQLLAGNSVGSIFKGVRAFVSSSIQSSEKPEIEPRAIDYQGITSLVLKYGGQVTVIVDKETTHYISPSIPVYYYRNIDNIKENMSLVSPDWVIDSVKSNKRLPTLDYLLITPQISKYVSAHTEDNIEPKQSPDKPNRKRQRLLTTMENPNFVKDYMSSSRLHYLSTWKNELQTKINNMILSMDVEPFQNQDSFETSRIIMHVDMDAFFVSVSTRNKPELQNKPVVISHGGKRSVCASTNYAARKLGVSNGCWLESAKELCGDDLVVLPYDFESYEHVSMELYRVFTKFSNKIQVVSCDEAILNVSNRIHSKEEALQYAESIRKEVHERTQCTCSVGIGNTKILSTMALKKAKPNGVHLAPFCESIGDFSTLDSLAMCYSSNRFMDQSDSIQWMSTFTINQLPGVGYSLSKRLKQLEIRTVDDLIQRPLSELKKTFGEQNGLKLFLVSRGFDVKPLSYETKRKSISVEISYGVRFTKDEQVYKFIGDVVDELFRRIQEEGMEGKTVSINVYKRKKDAQQLKGYLGHGKCTIHSKSISTIEYINSKDVLTALSIKLYKQFQLNPEDVRGIGLHFSKLKQATNKHVTLLDFMNKSSPMANFKKPLPFAPQRNLKNQIIPSRSNSKRKLTREVVFETEDFEISLKSIAAHLPNQYSEVYTEILQQYCLFLIESGNLEYLCRLLRHLSRLSTKNKDRMIMVERIVNVVQGKSEIIYGYKLSF